MGGGGGGGSGGFGIGDRGGIGDRATAAAMEKRKEEAAQKAAFSRAERKALKDLNEACPTTHGALVQGRNEAPGGPSLNSYQQARLRHRLRVGEAARQFEQQAARPPARPPAQPPKQDDVYGLYEQTPHQQAAYQPAALRLDSSYTPDSAHDSRPAAAPQLVEALVADCSVSHEAAMRALAAAGGSYDLARSMIAEASAYLSAARGQQPPKPAKGSGTPVDLAEAPACAPPSLPPAAPASDRRGGFGPAADSRRSNEAYSARSTTSTLSATCESQRAAAAAIGAPPPPPLIHSHVKYGRRAGSPAAGSSRPGSATSGVAVAAPAAARKPVPRPAAGGAGAAASGSRRASGGAMPPRARQPEWVDNVPDPYATDTHASDPYTAQPSPQPAGPPQQARSPPQPSPPAQPPMQPAPAPLAEPITHDARLQAARAKRLQADEARKAALLQKQQQKAAAASPVAIGGGGYDDEAGHSAGLPPLGGSSLDQRRRENAERRRAAEEEKRSAMLHKQAAKATSVPAGRGADHGSAAAALQAQLDALPPGREHDGTRAGLKKQLASHKAVALREQRKAEQAAREAQRAAEAAAKEQAAAAAAAARAAEGAKED